MPHPSSFHIRQYIVQIVLPLQTRIVLLPVCSLVVLVPVTASRLESTRARHRNLRWRLKKLNRKTFGHMPCDVAVHQPSARVVGLEGDCKPTGAWHSRCVTADRRSIVQRHAAGVCAGSLTENLCCCQHYAQFSPETHVWNSQRSRDRGDGSGEG